MSSDRSGSRAPLDTAEEIRLIAAAKHGDHASFEALVDRYLKSAIAVAQGYVGNRDDAADMAQEAVYRVFKTLDRFRAGEPFAPWFFRILRNTCMNFCEKYRRKGHFSIQAGRDDGGDDYPLVGGELLPPDQAELHETQRMFWKALETLPLKHREILMLRHFEDLDYAGIAAVLEIPIGTVMSRLFHARQNLKKAMEPYMEVPR